MSTSRIRVGVVFGGRSAEHEVSIQSANAVLAAIDRNKYEPVAIAITKKGQWQTLDAASPLSSDMELLGAGEPVSLLPEPSQHGLVPVIGGVNLVRSTVSRSAPTRLDVIFPLIHGPLGEDGTLQGLLDLADIPYVGSGVLGSAVGMDKAAMKALFAHHGLPVPPYKVFLRKRWQCEPDSIFQECAASFPLPWFVKPANLGSSIGVSKVNDRQEFTAAMEIAAQYDRKLLVEASIEDSREIEVGVLGNDEPIASVPGEVIPSHEFYDYDAKYAPEGSQLIVPASLPPEVATHLRSIALKAFAVLDCAGLARVDFLLKRSTNEVFVSEINTLPGFTPTSMYPRLWEVSGISYGELIDRLIQLALERHQDRQRNQTEYHK